MHRNRKHIMGLQGVASFQPQYLHTIPRRRIALQPVKRNATPLRLGDGPPNLGYRLSAIGYLLFPLPLCFEIVFPPRPERRESEPVIIEHVNKT